MLYKMGPEPARCVEPEISGVIASCSPPLFKQTIGAIRNLPVAPA